VQRGKLLRAGKGQQQVMGRIPVSGVAEVVPRLKIKKTRLHEEEIRRSNRSSNRKGPNSDRPKKKDNEKKVGRRRRKKKNLNKDIGGGRSTKGTVCQRKMN